MKNAVILFLIIFNWSILYGQQLTAVDAETNRPIPYTSIYIYQEHSKVGGMSCDEKGKALLPKINYDSLIATCIGYEDLKIEKKQLVTDTIKLKPQTTDLTEVVISKKNKLQSINYEGGRINYRFGLAMYSEFVMYFENKYNKPVPIKSFYFKIKKNVGTTVLRIVMYSLVDSVSHDKVGKSLLNKDIIYTIEPNTEGMVEIDLSEYDLVLPAEGAYLGTDTLQNLDENGNLNINYRYITRLESVVANLNYFLIYDKYEEERYNLYNFNAKHFMSFENRNDRKSFNFPNYGIKVYAD